MKKCIVCGSNRIYDGVCHDCGAVQPRGTEFNAYTIYSASKYNTPTLGGELGGAPVDLKELHLDSLANFDVRKSGRERKITRSVNRAISELNASPRLRFIMEADAGVLIKKEIQANKPNHKWHVDQMLARKIVLILKRRYGVE